MNRSLQALQWDIFCRVIDNFGDIGVCWRLAADLASRGQRVRLWVDDASALQWMASGGKAGVDVLAWPNVLTAASQETLAGAPCSVMVEAFGCEIAPEFIASCVHAARTTGIKPLWINLEYLSAEPYVERCHGLPSPVANGPAAGWTKWFFYPGFTSQTGGLLREADLPQRQATFDRSAWLRGRLQDFKETGETRLVSLFCYEPPMLKALLQHWKEAGLDGQPVHVMVAAGRAQVAFQDVLNGLQPPNNDQTGLLRSSRGQSLLSFSYLPLLTQTDFDHLLWACDLNFVRGEDSVVRALWAGKPFVWHIYPQDDDAHEAKLDAFLNMLEAPASLREFHHRWNSGQPGRATAEIDLSAWATAASAARSRLMAEPDLTTGLLQFVEKNR